MVELEELAIEEALRAELGKTSRFSKYGRQNRTPMTFVLDEAERQMGKRLSVYWVDDGPPVMFTLTGFSLSPVIFNTRYLSLTAFIRHLFVDDWLKNVLVESTEHTALKVMAEMALHRGDPEFAVLAFAKAITGQVFWTYDGDQVAALEHEPINEAYMATWFYGLAHEFGHLLIEQGQAFSSDHWLSDDSIINEIRTALEYFPVYPDSFKEEALTRARLKRSTSVLGIDQVRSEGLADFFAASLLFKTTFDIMREVSAKQFEVFQYVQEMFIFLNIISYIDRCQRVARIASSTTADREAQLEGALHPVSIAARIEIQRRYLDVAVAGYLFDHPTHEQYREVQSVIDEVLASHAQTIDRIDSGLSRAMEFAFFPQKRENDRVIMDAFQKGFTSSVPVLLETRRFCELADTLEVNGELLRELKGIVEDPNETNPT